MGLLNDLEMQLERQIPAQLQTALQLPLDACSLACPDCQLAMPRHHRCSRNITARCGAVRLQVPVFRCGECQGRPGA